MTFSLLAHDANKNIWCGAAATGNLCVGGWVLHGHARAGICASQGQSPSTLWADKVLTVQREGHTATNAIALAVDDDPGSAFRQVAAIDLGGKPAAYSGSENLGYCGHLIQNGVVASGNILAGPEVLNAMVDAFHNSGGDLLERMVKGLHAASHAGGDTRGILSAALLMVGPDIAPMSLRVDRSGEPLADLEELVGCALETGYQNWVATVPTQNKPHAAPPHSEKKITIGSSRR
jgi:uncharacterized Ntn-hydrolase superfamily protein